MPEEDLAWHAGVSYWRGSTRINDTSIGIELENRGWQKTAGVKVLPLSSGTDCGSDPAGARYHRPLPHRAAECGRPCGYRPAAQRRSGAVIPGNSWRSRGSAPGLTSSGWPLSQRAGGQRASGPRNRTGFALALWLSGDAGDDPAQKKRVIIAFQMHFRPQRWDGVADAQTEAIAEALLEKYGQVSGVVYRGREARRRCARCRRQASPPADSPARPARG